MSLAETNKEEIMKQIHALKELLGLSVPADDQQQFGEYTKYLPVFSAQERKTIKDKIMQLVKLL